MMKIIRTAAPEVEQHPINLAGLTEYRGVKLATGCKVTREELLKEDNCLDMRAAGCVAL